MLAVSPVAVEDSAEPIAPTTVGTAVSGFDALKPRDVQAICRELKLPTPTPDVPLASILEMNSLTVADVYVRMERATSMDAMIAAAVLRRGVTVLPKDPRLAPTPHRLRWDLTPDGKAGKPRPQDAEKRAADPGMPPEDHVVTAIGDCQSAAGSKRAARFALYRLGATVDELRASGVKGSDIRRHVSEGLVTFGPRAAQ